MGSIIAGSDSADYMDGRDGCDYMRGRGGGDNMHGSQQMDTVYGGLGNDRVIGEGGHDHLFGKEGSDFIDGRDGVNESGNIEEARGGPGTDECWLESDPDGVYFSECEQLNGASNPWGQKFVNTGDGGNSVPHRAEVNYYLNNHGG